MVVSLFWGWAVGATKHARTHNRSGFKKHCSASAAIVPSWCTPLFLISNVNWVRKKKHTGVVCSQYILALPLGGGQHVVVSTQIGSSREARQNHRVKMYCSAKAEQGEPHAWVVLPNENPSELHNAVAASRGSAEHSVLAMSCTYNLAAVFTVKHPQGTQMS